MTALHNACGIIVISAIFSVNQATDDYLLTTGRPRPEKPRPKDLSSSNAGMIGGIVGACIAVVVVVIGVVYYVRLRRGRQNQPDTKPDVNIAYDNHGNNATKELAVSDDKREPYTSLSTTTAVSDDKREPYTSLSTTTAVSDDKREPYTSLSTTTAVSDDKREPYTSLSTTTAVSDDKREPYTSLSTTTAVSDDKREPYTSLSTTTAVSDDKREPYTSLSTTTAVHVYDDLVRNVGGTSDRDEIEYSYISESDIIAAQKESGNPIPSVGNK
ncbi:uncharacterized protein LOC117331541 [Pecten maximus]|uniref:uncharacterized protein LOC117331541 n=1 Tax=Pecten maximus TaxID=6579 RepID=UPI001458778C|nr:uncharacterized protein LOC117331541 [Pecten maximus]XP_033746179.1 uncharacterized protein LOC117331541 [Pecten maximus]XP_033746180.1 uncharacterized protein LOC117331541 [Pecten maximus]